MQNVWRPLGRVLEPKAGKAWSVSHAAYPTALTLGDGNVRIFYSTRDASNRSSTASLDCAAGAGSISGNRPGTCAMAGAVIRARKKQSLRRICIAQRLTGKVGLTMAVRAGRSSARETPT